MKTAFGLTLVALSAVFVFVFYPHASSDRETKVVGAKSEVNFASTQEPNAAVVLQVSPELQKQNFPEVIDVLLEDIFTTSQMRPLLSVALQCDPNLIRVHLGVSVRAAREMAKGCTPTPSALFRKEPFQKNYSVWYRPGAQLSGWTDSANHTDIILGALDSVLSKPETRSFLCKILAHEFGIYFDNASRFVEPGSGAAAFGLNLSERDPQLFDLETLLEHPLIRDALAATRAFAVERNVLQELARKKPLLYVYHPDQYRSLPTPRNSAGQCFAYEKRLMERLFDSTKAREQNIPWVDLENPGWKMGIENTFGDFQRVRQRDLQNLSSLSLPTISKGRESICILFSTPFLGVTNNYLTSGPRPDTDGSGD